MAYLYSKGAEESFFLSTALNELFLMFFEDIKNAPFNSREKTVANKAKAQKAYGKEVDMLRAIALLIKNHPQTVWDLRIVPHRKVCWEIRIWALS